MNLKFLIFLAFAVLFLLADICCLIKMFFVLKKSKTDTVENLAGKWKPYLFLSGAAGVLLAACMVVMFVIK